MVVVFCDTLHLFLILIHNNIYHILYYRRDRYIVHDEYADKIHYRPLLLLPPLRQKDPHQKRFYTRGTLRNISILRLAKIQTLFRDWLILILIKKRVNYFICIEGKGSLKDIQCSAQNAALFVDLL